MPAVGGFVFDSAGAPVDRELRLYRRDTGALLGKTRSSGGDGDPHFDKVSLLLHMDGTTGLIAQVLYGTGMRLMEALRLRVKDIEFTRREIVVREGKGNKDRVTVLPENLIAPLQRQLEKSRALYEKDRDDGLAGVSLPHALAMKYPKAEESWAWQWVFPSPVRSLDPKPDPRTGQLLERRHHIYPESVQRAVR